MFSSTHPNYVTSSLPQLSESGNPTVQNNKAKNSEDAGELRNHPKIVNDPTKLKTFDKAATRDEDVPIVNKRQAIDKEDSSNKSVGLFEMISKNNYNK